VEADNEHLRGLGTTSHHGQGIDEVLAGRADGPRPILQRDVLEGDPLGPRLFRGFLPLQTVEEGMGVMGIATITV
jgi:hypothetical protein